MKSPTAPDDPARLGFLRVAAAVPVCVPAHPVENAKRIVELARRACDEGARLAAFPELSITGYTVGDLFLQKRLENAVADAIRLLCRELPETLAVVVGAPWRNGGMLFNTAAVIAGHRIAGIVPKTFLPNYKEFYEKRWFVPGGAAAESHVRFDDEDVLFGTDLLFHLPGLREVLFGVEICEDLWVPVPPSSFQALGGAQILINISASDETIGKSRYRHDHLVAAQSARCLAGMIYVSSGPGESSSDLVFGGHALIAENGTVLAEERRFQEGPTLAITDLDIDRIGAERDRTGSFADAAQASSRRYRIAEAAVTLSSEPALFTRSIEPHPFVPADPVTLDGRCEEVVSIQTAGLLRRLRHIEGSRPVLGLSGGLDSALAALIASRAVRELEKSPSRLLAVSMPGAGTSDRTKRNSRELARCLACEFREIEISESVTLHLKNLGHGGKPDITFENAQARERTQILMDLANAEKGIVIGTGDLTEIALGWSTYGGDHLSMYNVNASVPKTLVRHAVAWFAHRSGGALASVLTDILDTPISPELLPAGPDGTIQQKSEDILGPFELHDFFLYHFLRAGDPPEKLLFLARHAFGYQYSTRTLAAVLRIFLTRFFSSQFKRNAMPDGPKVGSVALSPRGDWRMPADVNPAAWLADFPEE